MSHCRILHGDCCQIMPTLEKESFDAIVTDPPYHLTTGKKGGSGQASLNLESPHGRARIGTGFMGMQWDGGDVAFDPATWSEALRILRPGGHLIAFGGTRTYHRLATAVETAGFEIRDQLLWIYGQGFPKNRKLGNGCGTALKPAHEPMVLARKPFKGSATAHFELTGLGGLNIDGCRIQINDDAYERNCSGDRGHDGTRSIDKRGSTDLRPGGGCANHAGRWPANLLHDGSEAARSIFPSESGAAAPVRRRNADKFRNTFGRFVGNVDEEGSTFYADSGGAWRYFWCPKACRSDRDAGIDASFPERPLYWSSGDSNPGSFQSPGTKKAARNFHPTVKPIELMRYLCRLVTPAGGHVLDLFCGSGSTGRAALMDGFDFTGIELDESYIPIAEARTRGVTPGQQLEVSA